MELARSLLLAAGALGLGSLAVVELHVDAQIDGESRSGLPWFTVPLLRSMHNLVVNGSNSQGEMAAG